jgi:hypothetical protein
MHEIEWFSNESVGVAVARAKETSRPLLVDFWQPTCLGCAKLFARTYPDAALRAVAPTFVWVKYDTTRPNTWFRQLNGGFAHQWHPDLLVLDPHLRELRRVIGYLPAAELVPQLEVARAPGRLYGRAHADALRILEDVVRAHPAAAVAPEALYWAGVADYRLSGATGLVRWWSRIAAEYPASEWRPRADCLDVVIPEDGFSPGDPTTVANLAG